VNVLLVGGDALIGGALASALDARGDRVVRTTRRTPTPGDGWMALDLLTPLPSRLPACEVAFFCAAVAGFKACRNAPQLSAQVNVSASSALAARLVANGARVVLLSTSAVFDCAEPRMRADRPYAPRGVYGAQKAAAERAFLSLGAAASVLRLAKVLTRGDPRILEWTNALREGRAVDAFHDHRISPLTLDDAVAALVALADAAASGIYQASAVDDWSYADLATELARQLAVPQTLVRACSAVGRIPDDEITPYTSLDSARLTQLAGFVAPPAATAVERALTSGCSKER
jgi:dTDP-4-dehydrorhamnose reductase